VTDTQVRPLTKHPAKFSVPILDVLDALVRREQRRLGRRITVFDPFAGVGRVHRLKGPRVDTYGMEIEPEWAACHSATTCGDSLRYMHQTTQRFDVVVTSPCYGNRLADHHDAQDGSTRRSYTHDLGRAPTEGSSATLPWGPRYWAFHAHAWRLVPNILRPADPEADDDGGLFILNVSDFVSRKQLVHAAEWHDGACWAAGFVRSTRDRRSIETRRLRVGQNYEARAAYETVLTYRVGAL
jgi:hypothetical protein